LDIVQARAVDGLRSDVRKRRHGRRTAPIRSFRAVRCVPGSLAVPPAPVRSRGKASAASSALPHAAPSAMI